MALDIAREEWKKAERRLTDYLTIYPLQEEMNEILMQVYADNGDTGKLSRHYAAFKLAYRQELGVELPQKLHEKVVNWIEKN
ncbi:two-component SAPR family response regulator [Paenibacillus sp. PastF-1]|nr:two-component SAPR family response regulator [Paenibacillus sp. PastF-2]MDF9852620.1 two-component SAPR family response regulator [Paenibacillus sp. PastF-1]MDH6505391.1 two-component SAPR family response regulator [Paenibacillus sp. PastM-3]